MFESEWGYIFYFYLPITEILILRNKTSTPGDFEFTRFGCVGYYHGIRSDGTIHDYVQFSYKIKRKNLPTTFLGIWLYFYHLTYLTE